MVKLEAFGPGDYDRLISWIDSAEMLMQFGGPVLRFPLTAEQLSKSIVEPDRHVFRVTDEITGTVVGHGEVYKKADGSTYLSRLLIGDPAARDKGYGTQLVDLLLAFTFDTLHQTEVYLLVFDWNAAAIHVYEKAGFHVVPDKVLIREVNGQQWTAITMVIYPHTWRRPDYL